MANFKVWVDHYSTGSNVDKYSDFANDSTRKAGFQSGEVVPSKKMNSILRQNSLVITALMTLLAKIT